jgi:ethanolamine utilization protein EutQ (cupin superfamily)
MATIIPKEHLQNGILFQGKDYGDIPISFFWMQLPPDGGPKLHYHPYDEIFIVLEGRATFTVDESTLEVEAGKFSQIGEESLRIVTIHPSPRTIGTRVEEGDK